MRKRVGLKMDFCDTPYFIGFVLRISLVNWCLSVRYLLKSSSDSPTIPIAFILLKRILLSNTSKAFLKSNTNPVFCQFCGK